MEAQQILLYDNVCQLCGWYSGLFVKVGLLKPNQVQALQHASTQDLQMLDVERACHEIPWIDRQQGKVYYGIDAILEVLSLRWPWMKPIANFVLIRFALGKLYKLISYNRRGIVASVQKEGGFQCAPIYNLQYKKIFIVLCFACSTYLLRGFWNNNFPIVFSILFGINSAAVLLSVFLRSHIAVEVISQWQLQCAIALVLLVPIFILAKFGALLAVIYGAIIFILMARHTWRRSLYLRQFVKQ